MTLRTFIIPSRRSFVALVVILAGTVVASPAARAAAVNYVALGDSYSSGVGTNSYDSASGSCYRSPQSYAQLWANSHTVASFRSAACSGATTSDVLASQVSALGTSTTMVTITIGGNDVGFVDTITTCQLGSASACTAAVDDATDAATTTLPALLDKTYAAIRSAAPNATLIVLGYPRLFELSTTCGLLDMSLANRTTLNSGADVLAGVIAGRAAAAGATFVDVRSSFSGHGVCAGTAWINRLTLPLRESYHPNASGYRSGDLVALNAVTG